MRIQCPGALDWDSFRDSGHPWLRARGEWRPGIALPARNTYRLAHCANRLFHARSVEGAGARHRVAGFNAGTQSRESDVDVLFLTVRPLGSHPERPLRRGSIEPLEDRCSPILLKTGRPASCTLRAILRNGVFGQQRGLSGHTAQSADCVGYGSGVLRERTRLDCSSKQKLAGALQLRGTVHSVLFDEPFATGCDHRFSGYLARAVALEQLALRAGSLRAGGGVCGNSQQLQCTLIGR
jgi:hypothetical protein